LPTYIADGGFAAKSGAPDRANAEDWFIWHFTHLDNLDSIVEAGAVLSSARIKPPMNVADLKVKARRDLVLVQPDRDYPAGKYVKDHVPWYIAAKSPMLYVVSRGHEDYAGGTDALIFLGINLGDLARSGLIWCASDRNAAAFDVEFSRDLSSLGDFVDFNLLCAKMWARTPEDPTRATRRAAEVLVLDAVPLELVTAVVARTEVSRDAAWRKLRAVGGVREYWHVPKFYY